MKFRLSWLLNIFIYLLVNGNLFAAPVHLCHSMAANETTSLSSSDTLKIHQHHAENNNLEQSMTIMSEEHQGQTMESQAMEDCSCTDCDCTKSCTTSNIGQVTVYLESNLDLISYVPSVSASIAKRALNFISQPQSNPLRPPIIT